MTILLAVALVFNLPAVVQRAIPDYTSTRCRTSSAAASRSQKLKLGGIVNDQNKELSNCTNGVASSCRTAVPHPTSRASSAWLNTPGDKPIDLPSLRGKVVLIDFWAYSCINCQRAIPHVAGWYKRVPGQRFEVIGVHTPEYAFEKVAGNVAKALPTWASRTRSPRTTATRRGPTTATSTGLRNI